MFDVSAFDVAQFDSILARGLTKGVGQRDGQMCIEAAICTVLDSPHGDDPGCVAFGVRAFKIGLNDANWSNPEARAAGLRDLGLAQLGSLGVVSDRAFSEAIALKTVQVLLPAVLLETSHNDSEPAAIADRCAKAVDLQSAAWAAEEVKAWADKEARAEVWQAAREAAWAAEAAWAWPKAERAAETMAARVAMATLATWGAAEAGDKYLLLSASLALQVLRDLHSPGCELLAKEEKGNV